MYTGIAIYGTDPSQALATLSAGEALFREFGAEVTEASYLEFVLLDGERTVDGRELPPAELSPKISSGIATAFRLDGGSEQGHPPTISFGHNVPTYGGLSLIDAQISRAVYDIREELARFLELIAGRMPFKYAIAYSTDKAFSAYAYAFGVNLLRLFPFEKTWLFVMDLPNRSPGLASYESTKLRMVYPLNVLNPAHLAIRVGELSLKAWIESDPTFGSLRELPRDMWLWSVEEAHLHKVNEACGEAGILLAWHRPIPKPVRKLP